MNPLNDGSPRMVQERCKYILSCSDQVKMSVTDKAERQIKKRLYTWLSSLLLTIATVYSARVSRQNILDPAN